MIHPGDILSFSFLANHLVMLGILLVLTLSLNLILGCAGLFHLGHQGFWAVGAYAAGAMTVGLHSGLPGSLVFALSLAAGAAMAALAGLVIGAPCLRLRGDHIALATLAFAEIIRVLLNNVEWLGGSRGLRLPTVVVARTPETTRAYFTFYLILVGSAVALALVVFRNLLHSRYGRTILSIREDEVAAELMGVPIARRKLLVFVLGAAFAGLGGAIYAHFFGVISPKDFGVMTGVLLVLMVVLGGARSMTSTAAATVLLYVAQQLFKLGLLGLPRLFAEATGSVAVARAAEGIERFVADRWQLAFALLLIVLMLAAPGGLLAKGQRSRTTWLPRWWTKLRGGVASGEA